MLAPSAIAALSRRSFRISSFVMAEIAKRSVFSVVEGEHDAFSRETVFAFNECLHFWERGVIESIVVEVFHVLINLGVKDPVAI